MSDRCVAPWSKYHDGPEFLRITALPERQHSDISRKSLPRRRHPVICHFADGHQEKFASVLQAEDYLAITSYKIYDALARKRKGGPGMCHSEYGDFWPELMEVK